MAESPQKTPSKIILFDFDSTLISVESLDKLLFHQYQLYLDSNPSNPPYPIEAFKEKINNLTNVGMGGQGALKDTIEGRFGFFYDNVPEEFWFKEEDINVFAQSLIEQVTPGMEKIINLAQEIGAKVMIVSGGFKELIVPVAQHLGISKNDIVANRFEVNEEGKLWVKSNYDTEDLPSYMKDVEPLNMALALDSEAKNKVIEILKHVYLGIDKIMIGDGATDADTVRFGAFMYLFVQHQNRINNSSKLQHLITEHLGRDLSIVNSVEELKVLLEA